MFRPAATAIMLLDIKIKKEVLHLGLFHVYPVEGYFS
jgi:hypothetical protein